MTLLMKALDLLLLCQLLLLRGCFACFLFHEYLVALGLAVMVWCCGINVVLFK